MSYHREYKKLYDTSRWKKLRLLQLAAEPFCDKCKAKGLTVPAQVVHHVVPHKGNLFLFYCGKLQSLCKQCHDVITGRIEPHGFTNDIGSDGWPTDNNHPVYSERHY